MSAPARSKQPISHSATTIDWTAIALVIAVALIACLAGIGNDYTQDDGYLIRDNFFVHSPANIGHFFSAPFWPPPFSPDLYRPLTSLVLSIQYVFGSGEPTVFRVVSYSLYAACAVAVFSFAKRFLSREISLGVALVFAAHPVHVEAIALAVAQNEIAVALIAIAATGRYIDCRRGTGLKSVDWAVLVALYATACLFKEQGFVLPGLLIAAELFLVMGRDKDDVKRLALGFIAMITVGVGLLLVRRAVLGSVGGTFVSETLIGASFGTRALTMLQIVPQWLRLLVWPAHLQSDYSAQEIVASTGFGMPEATGLVLIISAVAAVWYTRRRAPLVAFGITWCGVALFPVSNLLLPTAILLAERTMFLPSVGALLAIGAALRPTLDQAFAKRRQIAWAAIGVIAAVGTLRSIERQRVWRNEGFLDARTVQDAPRSFRAQRAYADLLFEVHQDGLAKEAYGRAIQLSPRANAWRVRNDFARALRRQEQRGPEAEQLSISLADRPDQLDARGYLVAAELALGRYAAASAQCDSALARGGAPAVFNGLKQLADSAARVHAAPGAIQVAISLGDSGRSR